MSLIIAATDFTETGENAVHYACKLAETQQAALVVIHTFIVPVMFTDLAVPTNLINDTQNDAEQNMRQLIERLNTSCHAPGITGRVIYGDIADALNEYSTEQQHPMLAVIGNNKQDTVSVESTLVETFRHSKYPVLAIPSGATFHEVKKICFAFDNNYKGSGVALQQLRDIQTKLGAELHVLYAQKDGLSRDNNEDIDVTTQRILEPAHPKYHFRYGASIEASIKEFVAEQQIDWLVLMPRTHSFFESIFHKSHAKAMAHDVQIPILALQENK